jgi:hypothetical protein
MIGLWVRCLPCRESRPERCFPPPTCQHVFVLTDPVPLVKEHQERGLQPVRLITKGYGARLVIEMRGIKAIISMQRFNTFNLHHLSIDILALAQILCRRIPG